MNLPPDDQLAFFGDEDGDELHLIFDFTVIQAMYLALARGDATPLRPAGALPEIPDDASGPTSCATTTS